MFFKIQKLEDDRLQADYDRAMKELNEFYSLDWVYNRPQIIVVPDRKTINDIWDKKSEDWQIGWADGRFAFVLDNESMEENSSHKKRSPEKYYALIKHELSHIFFRQLGKSNNGPKWLWEGVAIYTSGQLDFLKPIKQFEKFLDSDQEGKPGLYEETGYAVQLLVNKFGKDKLLELIKNLSSCKTSEAFNQKFEEIYSFAPTIENFNLTQE
jgi:hypothetical protein